MKKSDIVFLIMAGGSGTRFWPLSSRTKPKQFLSVFTGKPLIVDTFNRILPLAENEGHIFVSTAKAQARFVKRALPNIDNSRVICDPIQRDTAAAIGFASEIIASFYNNPIIVVLPSDHHVSDETEFRRVISLAVSSVKDKIITIGIKPSRPETDYGYIESDLSCSSPIKKVLHFKEKPDFKTASDYLQSGKYFWNSGIFIFSYPTIMDSFRYLCPAHYEILSSINKYIKTLNQKKSFLEVYRLFKSFSKVSIDYAIMEKASNIYVIPASFGWDDVGSFLALERLLPSDGFGNTCVNCILTADKSNNNVLASEKPTQVILLGINDAIIVRNGNKILVASRSCISDLKQQVILLEKAPKK
jgi:mannose-1-phosphate guanylyltransferase